MKEFNWTPKQKNAWKDLTRCAISHGLILRVNDGEEIFPATTIYPEVTARVEAVEEAWITFFYPPEDKEKPYRLRDCTRIGTAYILLPGHGTCSPEESVADWTTHREGEEKNFIDLWWDVFFEKEWK